MDQYRGTPFDLTGRILSIFAILASAGSAGYVYMQNSSPQAKHADEQLSTLVDEKFAPLAEAMKKQWDEDSAAELAKLSGVREKWNNQFSEGLDGFQDDAKNVLTLWKQNETLDRQDRQLAFRQFMDGIGRQTLAAKPEISSPDDVTAGSDRRNPEDIFLDLTKRPGTSGAAEIDSANDLSGEIVNSDGPNQNDYRLELAQLDVAPTDGSSSIISIRNPGTSQVEISRIRFRPRRHFDVPRNTSSLKPLGERYVSLRVIPFLKFHNTSADKSEHSYYVMDLDKGLRVAPGETVHVRMNLENSSHTGYGYRGDVTFLFGDDDSLLVPNAQLNFVEEQTPQPAPALSDEI